MAFRREGDTAWTQLATGLVDPIYVWDTASVTSGHYVLQIAASDALSQPTDQALTGELESAVVEVDAVAPVVTVRPATRVGDRLAVTVEVRDLNTRQSPGSNIRSTARRGRRRILRTVSSTAAPRR